MDEEAVRRSRRGGGEHHEEAEEGQLRPDGEHRDHPSEGDCAEGGREDEPLLRVSLLWVRRATLVAPQVGDPDDERSDDHDAAAQGAQDREPIEGNAGEQGRHAPGSGEKGAEERTDRGQIGRPAVLERPGG